MSSRPKVKIENYPCDGDYVIRCLERIRKLWLQVYMSRVYYRLFLCLEFNRLGLRVEDWRLWAEGVQVLWLFGALGRRRQEVLKRLSDADLWTA